LVVVALQGPLAGVLMAVLGAQGLMELTDYPEVAGVVAVAPTALIKSVVPVEMGDIPEVLEVVAAVQREQMRWEAQAVTVEAVR
jgi:hypothetical protein